MQNVAVLRQMNQLSWNLVCRVRRDHITTSQSFEKISTESRFSSRSLKTYGHTVYDAHPESKSAWFFNLKKKLLFLKKYRILLICPLF